MTKRRTAPRKLGPSLLYHAVMLAIAVVFLLPFYWMAISAFKTTDEIFANPVTWFPNPIHWANVPDLLTRTDFPFLRQFFNSVFYAGSVALAVVFFLYGILKYIARGDDEESQKKGKKRMKQFGRVEIPQEAFMAVLSVDNK